MSDSYTLWLVEAKSIQRYLFAGGKMRDTVAASEIVEQLSSRLLSQSLTQAALSEDGNLKFLRRGGGKFYCYVKDESHAVNLGQQLHQAAFILGILVEQLAPSLEVNSVLLQGNDLTVLRELGKQQLAQQRQQPRLFPLAASPFTRRAPRTGLPAVAAMRGTQKLPEYKDNAEWVDASTFAKRRFELSVKKNKAEWQTLDGKFFSSQDTEYRFPTTLQPEDTEKELDAFPFESDVQWLAMLHIDGNALGEKVATLAMLTDHPNLLADFSTCVTQVTRQAAQTACEAVLIPHKSADNVLPARPLVLGGDDLTMIVRADLAIAFAKAFQQAFQTLSYEALTTLFKNNVKSAAPKRIHFKRLTSCAGICFFKSKQPFVQAYQLAESLCDYAKRSNRALSTANEASFLSFYRLINEQYPDAASAIAAHSNHFNEQQVSLCHGVYALDTAENQPSFKRLEGLVHDVMLTTGATSHCDNASHKQQQHLKHLGKYLSHGKLRQLASLYLNAPEQRQGFEKRLYENNPQACEHIQSQIHQLAEPLRLEAPKQEASEQEAPKQSDFTLFAVPYHSGGENHYWSPLVDLLTLMQFHTPADTTPAKASTQQPQTTQEETA